jgi:hypothetical protein
MSDKCNGCDSPITKRPRHLCHTCARWTLKPGAQIKGRVILVGGIAECEHWVQA